MPIYEYQCKSCGHDMEALQKMSDAPLVTCPACGEDTLKKKISAAAFRLKGGGWYETDFKSGNKKNVAGERGGESASGSDKSTGEKSAGDKSGGDKAASASGKSGSSEKSGDTKKATGTSNSSSNS